MHLDRTPRILMAIVALGASWVICRGQSRELVIPTYPSDIKLTNGFVMHDCSIVRWEADGVILKYVGGTVPVKLANISTEQRQLFLDGKELDRVLQQRNAARERQQAPRPMQTIVVHDAPQAPSVDQESEERKRDEIKHGVTWHELVVGMTQDEALQCMGAPPSQKLGDGSTWIYAHRGKGFKDPINPDYGAKDRWLTFRNGILVRWDDV